MLISFSNYSNLYLFSQKQFLEHYFFGSYEDQGANAMAHIPYNEEGYVALGTWLVRQLDAYKRKPYKVLVVDCDNVLWDGICGESQLKDLKVDLNYKKFQQFLIKAKERGMLIILCSKNIEKDVFNVIDNHPDMILKREDLAGWYINWERKSSNIRKCSQDLQLSLESFIFMDDSPIECAEVVASIPELVVLQAPQKLENFYQFLQHLWIFDSLKLTLEDKQRTSMYKQNFLREKERLSSSSFKNFIESLNLKVDIDPLTITFLPRAHQLIYRTNQFNTTSKRLDENELKNNISNILMVQVSDRFGDYGLVGLVHYNIQNYILEVSMFLLSCRVLARGVEHNILNSLIALAQKHYCNFIHFHFIPSERNQPAYQFLSEIGIKIQTPLDEMKDLIVFQIDVKKTTKIHFDFNATKTPTSSESLISPELPPHKENLSCIYQEIAKNSLDIKNLCLYLNIPIEDNITALNKKEAEDVSNKLATILSKILKIDRESVNNILDFSKLEINSITIVRIILAIEREFGKKIEPPSFYKFKSFSELVRLVTEEKEPGDTINVNNNLLQELEASIKKIKSFCTSSTELRGEHVFLTGATGFLGAYLLKELLIQTDKKIYCLVRAADFKEGIERISTNALKYQIELTNFLHRICIVNGDLEQPNFAIEKKVLDFLKIEIGFIYHNAAAVNFVSTYDHLKKSNVDSVLTLIEFCFHGKQKQFSYISSNVVFDSIEYFGKSLTVREDTPLPAGDNILGGYAQTKWIAENLLKHAAENGLHVNIFRPGIIISENFSSLLIGDAFSRFFQLALELNKIPLLDDESTIILSSVEFLSRAVVILSEKQNSKNFSIFHLGTSILYKEILSIFKKRYCEVDVVTFENFLNTINKHVASNPEHPIFPLLPIFFDKINEQLSVFEALGKRPLFNSEDTFNKLANYGIYPNSIPNILF